MLEAKYYGKFVHSDPDIQAKLREIPWHFPFPDGEIEQAFNDKIYNGNNILYNYNFESSVSSEDIVQVGYYFDKTIVNQDNGCPKYYSIVTSDKKTKFTYFYTWASIDVAKLDKTQKLPNNALVYPVDLEIFPHGRIVERWHVFNRISISNIREFCFNSDIDVNNFTDEDINLIKMKFA